ncbi:MAG: hypothetical protein AMXMBFR47_00720 [Planctomycetota bacterium]
MDAPLSAAIAAMSDNAAEWNRFIEIFRTARLGINVPNRPEFGVGEMASTAENPLRVSASDHAGARMVLVFADPDVFHRNFGKRFNGVVTGEKVLEIVAYNDDCHGILINSALAEISAVINRETVFALLGRPDSKQSEKQ